jgi:hypothetical protein
MAFPYGRHESYTPLGDSNTMYNSPGMIQQPFSSHEGDLGSPPIGMGSPPIEMHGRPNPMHRQSENSMHSVGSRSSLFPQPNARAYSSNSGMVIDLQPSCLLVLTASFVVEAESFLHDPINKIDTHSFSSSEYQPFKDNTGRQLAHLLIGSSARWLITVGLCAAYILTVKIWIGKGSNGHAISENSKRVFNTITTAISLALGLNVSSAFKDLTLYMRWPILSSRKRSLKEVRQVKLSIQRKGVGYKIVMCYAMCNATTRNLNLDLYFPVNFFY